MDILPLTVLSSITHSRFPSPSEGISTRLGDFHGGLNQIFIHHRSERFIAFPLSGHQRAIACLQTPRDTLANPCVTDILLAVLGEQQR